MLSAIMMSAMASAAQNTEITVYNQGFGLVKEQRDLTLKAGTHEVTVEDVAQRIEANSVSIRSISDPGSFSVLEQNYRYDLIGPESILAKSVGKKVILNRVLPSGSKERVVGTLLSSPSSVVNTGNGEQMRFNGMVVQTEDGRVLLNPVGEVEVERIPDGLISKPSLVWLLDSDKAGSNRVELSYLTQGINWTADYVLNLDQAGKLGDMKGWVTLTNQTGTSFMNTRLKLLAGEVFRPEDDNALKFRRMEAAAAMPRRGAEMVQEEFAEYHLYTAPRPVTVANNEMKQVSLLEGFGVPARKKLIVDATRAMGYWQPQEEGAVGSGPIKPLVLIEFVNNKESNLGMPMPAGKIKIFQRDSTGSLQMLGEARINHTPREEKLSLPVGRSFDIVAERKRTAFTWLNRSRNRDGARETWEIEVRNRKETAETVNVIERSWGQWKITQSSDPQTKLDANTFEFIVTLQPNQVKKITYTIETIW